MEKTKVGRLCGAEDSVLERVSTYLSCLSDCNIEVART